MTEVATQQGPMTPVERSKALVSYIRHPEFLDQVAMALPEGMPKERFVRAAVTAILEDQLLSDADPHSIYRAVIKCAQDGLLPDRREAALVVYNTKDGKKAQYLPMIGGLRKIAAEYGWDLRAVVVYENDEFNYELGLETNLVHRRARIGTDRGAPVAAYCVATHRSGRKVFEVMDAAEIDKVRATSKQPDRGPWKDWTERMWEKTVARRAFKTLGFDPNDQRVQSILADIAPADAADALYGPRRVADAVVVDRSTGEIIDQDSPGERAASQPDPRSHARSGDGGGPGDQDPGMGARTPAPNDSPAGDTDGANQASVGDQQAGAEHVAAPTNPQGDDVSAPVPGDEDEPAVGSPFVAPAAATVDVEAAGQAVITRTEQKGRTLAELAELEKADEWLQWAIRRAESYWGSDFRIALEAFVAARFPEMWAAFVQERDNR